MNVTKAASTPVTIEIKISENEKINVWALPSKVTQEFLDKRKGSDYPISKILTELVHDWDLTHDVEVEEDFEDSGTKKKKTATRNEKLPISQKAIDEEVPLWLQNMIWQEIFQYRVPNLMKSNP